MFSLCRLRSPWRCSPLRASFLSEKLDFDSPVSEGWGCRLNHETPRIHPLPAQPAMVVRSHGAHHRRDFGASASHRRRTIPQWLRSSHLRGWTGEGVAFEMAGNISMKKKDYSTLLFRCHRHGSYAIKTPVVMDFGVEKIIGPERALCPKCGFEMNPLGVERSPAALKQLTL